MTIAEVPATWRQARRSVHSKSHERSGRHPDRVLLGDIGGTNARFALLESGNLSAIESVSVVDYAGFPQVLEDILRKYQSGEPLTDVVLAVAGPVENERCILTNSGWLIDSAALRHRFGFTRVHLLNDFAAIAWALPRLAAADLFGIGGGKAVPGAPAAVLGSGTGLGLACFLTGPHGAMVLETEGGHATLPATSSRESAIIAHLRGRFGHVSAERALSGGGLENLYHAILAVDGAAAPDRTAAEITQAATSGSCAVSTAALDMFCAMLGTVAGNVALTLGARGGVYIAGGIAPRLVHYLQHSEFRARFEAKGRFQSYLSAIPTSVIVHPHPAFIGLRVLAEQQFGGALTGGADGETTIRPG